MPTDGSQPLQAWTCVKCGAALPLEAGTGELVTCGYCGTPFKLPAAEVRHGGINISGGSVFIGGDLVGGSKRVIVTSEAPSAATIWDEPDTSDEEGVSIEGEAVQVCGDMVGGSVVTIVQPAPTTQAVPAAVVTPKVAIEPAPKLGWWKKIKRLFAN